MNASFSAAELAEAANGVWRTAPDPGKRFELHTDTRQPGAGKIFLAFAGENFDAHDYLASAVAAGCAALCVNAKAVADGKVPDSVPALIVEDTIAAYQAFGRLHRRRFPALKIAAVTGSVGKTSVKEMLRAIFTEAAGSEDAVLATIGNTNNQIGVPQNLLRLTPLHRFAVLEMGTNHHGEIEPLSRTAEPQAAIVNTIAACHLEHLGSLDGVAAEKAHIFDGLAADGCAILPLDSEQFPLLAAKAAAFRQCRFGAKKNSDIRANYLGGDLDGSEFELTFPGGETFHIRWTLTGAHQAVNAAAAAGAALALGVAPASIAAGLANTRLIGMRMARSLIGGVTYLNDAYNANPESMAAALRQLAELNPQPEPFFLILGDMLELGASEAGQHAAVLKLALEKFPRAAIIPVGPRFAAAAAGIPRLFVCPDAAAAKEALAARVTPGALVFLKASRGMALEKVMPAAPEH